MNIKSNILIALTLIVFSVSAQTVDRNVTVEREYKPVIQDAGKITSVPGVTEANVQKSAATYNDINLPLQVGQNIQTLSAADLELEKRKTPDAAFVRIGAGNYLNNMLDFALPVITRGDMRLDLKANHLATFGTKTHSTSNASLIFNNYYGKMEMLAGVNVGYEYFNYYGKNYNKNGNETNVNMFQTGGNTIYKEIEENFYRISRDAKTVQLSELQDAPTNDGLWRFNTYLGVKSAPAKAGLRYEAVVNYNKFSSRNGLTEDIIHTKAGFNNVNGKNRMGIDIELQNMFYKSNLTSFVINVWDAYSVFSMNPYYSFERENWNVRLGVKSSFSFVYGHPFSPSPDIFAEWKAIPRWLAFYGGVGGNYKVNTLDVSMTENRFLFSDLRLQDTYTPVNAFFGIKIKPVYNLLLDAFISYKYIDNQYFFINKDYKTTTAAKPEESTVYTNKFNAIYSSASLTNVGFRANYNIRNSLNVQLKGVYNGWKTFDIPVAWQKPKFEADLTGEVRISRNMNVNGSLFYKGGRQAKLGDMSMIMKPVTDLNLGASYTYLNWFTMFAKVNNLLNSNYQEYYGYEVQGLNVMVGASFSF